MGVRRSTEREEARRANAVLKKRYLPSTHKYVARRLLIYNRLQNSEAFINGFEIDKPGRYLVIEKYRGSIVWAISANSKSEAQKMANTSDTDRDLVYMFDLDADPVIEYLGVERIVRWEVNGSG